MTFRATALLAVPAVLLGAGGCIPPTFPEDNLPMYEERPVEATFEANQNAVWEATLQVFSDLYPLDVIDKERGFISTEWVVGASDYIFNVYSGTRIPEKVRFRMTIDVGDKSGRALVRVRNHEQVEKDIISANLEFTGSIYEWIDVPTSSRKERDALEDIAQQLDKGRGRAKADVDLRE
ncbi:MAG: hypothetical protein Q8P41_20880 [Pseudomonadota bacterium]|nr:hypothetical protein [Pseudomonadota bacterium]